MVETGEFANILMLMSHLAAFFSFCGQIRLMLVVLNFNRCRHMACLASAALCLKLPEVAVRGELLATGPAGKPAGAVGLHVQPELGRVLKDPVGDKIKILDN